jgi:hypothetical protein
MPGDRDELLQQMLDLIARLYADTEGFLQDPGDQQRWYNRGYANGMIRGLRALGFADQLERLPSVDPNEVVAGHEVMAWGKAYRHGEEVGEREIRDVLEPRPAE